jgi:hypothetical protein
MVICPWCGTNYQAFRSNCDKCGGRIQLNEGKLDSLLESGTLPDLPPAPRAISNGYAWKLLLSDGWSIPALIFGFMGLIFSLVGAALTFGIVTAFVGIPFLLFGLVFLALGAGLFQWRYRLARQGVKVLREGEATRGQIMKLQENYSIEVNGRHPWVIHYQFQVDGLIHECKQTTLNPPQGGLQVGQTVCVLYLPTAPEFSSIYPHP